MLGAKKSERAQSNFPVKMAGASNRHTVTEPVEGSGNPYTVSERKLACSPIFNLHPSWIVCP